MNESINLVTYSDVWDLFIKKIVCHCLIIIRVCSYCPCVVISCDFCPSFLQTER